MNDKNRLYNLMLTRKKANLTQKQLSKKSGVSTNSIASYETGRRQPSLTILKKLAKALNCDIKEII